MKRFVAGPCVIESAELLDKVAETLVGINERLGVDIIFKASFDKANRTSLSSYRGVGLDKGLQMMDDVKRKWGLKLCTDIHEAWQAAPAGEVIDVLQIPAFLCRQTDLLLAAARTGKVVNIKKGQFLSPEAMRFAADKVASEGNDKVMLTDRGTTFGYTDLIVDMRSIPLMQTTGYPVIVDITHSLQQPNQSSGVTGGQPQMIETIARASVAAGCDGLFIETHPEPSQAKSDGANMLRLDLMENLLKNLCAIKTTINSL